MPSFLESLVKRKFLTTLLGAAVLIGAWYGYKSLTAPSTALQYVSAPVEKGTLISSVSGTGQVSSSNQVDVKAQAGGEVLEIPAQNGDTVKNGALLVRLDSGEASKASRDAQLNLESAQIALEKLKQPPTDYAVLQAENSIATSRRDLQKLKLSQDSARKNAEETLKKTQADLGKEYEDAYSAISGSFLDMPGILTGLNDSLASETIADGEATVQDGQTNENVLAASFLSINQDQRDRFNAYLEQFKKTYDEAKRDYSKSLELYKGSSRSSDHEITENLLALTLESARKIADTVNDLSNTFDFWVDYRNVHQFSVFSGVTQYQSNFAQYTTEINSHISALLAAQSAIQGNKDTTESAQRDLDEMAQNDPLDLAAAQADLKEKEAALINLKKGPDALDLRSQELAVRQRQNALTDANENLTDYSVKAPFDGVIAAVSVKVKDVVSSGTAVATLVTQQRIAEISLNEVDAAKVKTGQKATLTFDAIEGLSMSGQVTEIDTIGTATQGVVSYGVKIVFDTQDERVKAGMSVSANIITDVRSDTLIVPGAAVKTDESGESYVEILENGATRRQPVETGASSDTSTEIISGVKEGDPVVTQTINPAQQSAAPAPSGGSNRGGLPGLGGGGSGGLGRLIR